MTGEHNNIDLNATLFLELQRQLVEEEINDLRDENLMMQKQLEETSQNNGN